MGLDVAERVHQLSRVCGTDEGRRGGAVIRAPGLL